MKRYSIITLALLMVISTSSVLAQSRTAYFMHNTTQRYDLNPALSPTRGYFSLPVVNLTAGLETNFLKAENFFFPDASSGQLVTFMHKSISADTFLANMRDMNTMSLKINDRILGVGNYFRGGFWSIGINLRSETDINIPKEFFALTKSLKAGSYDISGLGIETNNFVEAALGYTFPVQDVFTLGVRAKVLVGLAHAKVTLDKLDITVGEEEYRADMAGSIEANVAGFDFDALQGEITFSQFTSHLTNISNNFNPQNISSIGLAFDAGIEWLLMDDQLHLSAAVNDLGYTSWSTQNTYRATVDNVGYSFQGYDIANNEVVFEQPENIVMNRSAVEAEGGKYKTTLHANYVGGIEYNFLGEKMALGALWVGKQYDDFIDSTLSASLTVRPTHWLSASVSETFMLTYGGSILGAAINICPSIINLFIGMDYISMSYGSFKGGKIPVPLNQDTVNFTFGLSFPLGVKMF